MINEQLIYHMAAVQERKRLGRELHDCLAPEVGYLKVQAILIDKALEAGEVAKARQHLQALHESLSNVYTDVRQEIFNLRNQFASSDEFLPALEEYLSMYEDTYGLEVELVLDGADPVELPVRVSSQVFRIIQEALTNIRKHAQASQVTLQVETEGDQVCFTLEDNGRGFDPTRLNNNGSSFGLQIMHERAESIDSSLQLEASPGNGSRLSLYVTNHRPVVLQSTFP